MDAKQLVCVGKPPRTSCLPSCRCLVCAQNPENPKGVPGAGRGAAKTVGYGCDLRAPLGKCRRGAILRKCEPLLAHAGGNTYCSPAGAPRKRSEPMGGCTAQPDRLVADAHRSE